MSDLMLVRHHAHTGKLSMSETKHRFTGIGSLLETLYTVHMARQYNGYLACICMTPKIYNSMKIDIN